MHIEDRDQMISLLKLVGYVQMSFQEAAEGGYLGRAFTHARLPTVNIRHTNCEVYGASSVFGYGATFLSFDEVWEVISTEAWHDS